MRLQSFASRELKARGEERAKNVQTAQAFKEHCGSGCPGHLESIKRDAKLCANSFGDLWHPPHGRPTLERVFVTKSQAPLQWAGPSNGARIWASAAWPCMSCHLIQNVPDFSCMLTSNLSELLVPPEEMHGAASPSVPGTAPSLRVMIRSHATPSFHPPQ